MGDVANQTVTRLGETLSSFGGTVHDSLSNVSTSLDSQTAAISAGTDAAKDPFLYKFGNHIHSHKWSLLLIGSTAAFLYFRKPHNVGTCNPPSNIGEFKPVLEVQTVDTSLIQEKVNEKVDLLLENFKENLRDEQAQQAQITFVKKNASAFTFLFSSVSTLWRFNFCVYIYLCCILF